MLTAPTHHIFNGREDLGECDLAGVVGKFALIANLVVEVSTTGVLQHQVEAARHLHDFIETDHVGVLHGVHAADFPGEKSLRLIVKSRLVQDFKGHFIWKDK